MTSLEIEKNAKISEEVTAEVSVQTHIRTAELEELLGVKSSAFYKDIEFLNIEVIKDNQKRGWISNEDFERLKLLRKHIEITGRRTGFQELKDGELVTVEDNKITNNSNNKNGQISNQEIYVTPEDPKDNMDLDAIIRKGAQLKAREIAMPHLVVRAIADKLEEYELPEDLQEKIEDAREAANPKFTPSEVADSILMNYRQNLA